MCALRSACCNTPSSCSIPGICHCAIFKLNLSFPVNFQCRPLGSRHRRALAEPARLQHPQVFAVLPLLSQGEGARLVLLCPAFPSHKFNCAKQKNRLEIEPRNKEGLISFVSVLAFCFSVCLLLCFFFFFSSPLECRRGMPPFLCQGFILEETV